MADTVPMDLLEAVNAARELTHAACHLADIAARATRDATLPEVARAGALAMEASIRAAQGAFSLEDSWRAGVEKSAVLWLAVESISIAQETIEVAREALEAVLSARIATAPRG